MNKAKKVLTVVSAAALTLTMGLAATACGGGGSGEKKKGNTLIVGYSNFNEKFSPFFAETSYDQDVATMTSVTLLPSDRDGNVVKLSKTGETIPYNGTDYTYNGLSDLTITENDDGTVYYDFDLRNDVKFSDGENLTADDAIFTMYVYSDPTYDGSSTFFSLPIEGMSDYRAGVSAKWQLIYADLSADKTDNKDKDYYTDDDKTTFLTAWNKAGVKFAQSIVDYCIANYADYGAKDVATSAGLWGFELPDGATATDFWNAIFDHYGYNTDGLNGEKAGSAYTAYLSDELDASMLKGVQTGESAPNITGIQKTGDYSIRIVLTEISATAIYQLPITVTPMHYYGDTSKYDYANNKFGFDKGDLSTVRAKTTKPLGAGPYKYTKYENGVVYFEANQTYYLGAPKTRYIQFKEGSDKDKVNGVIQGTTDLTDPSFSTDTVETIEKANSNGTLYGDKVTISAVDFLGYGYLGMSAKRVKVGDQIDSAESKNLRKALATVFSVYRELSVKSYYKDRANVINYPISNTSWAAPKPADEGYEVAFSKDVDGNPIYTSQMTADERYAAAEQAALGYLEAAGYTIENGKATAAPAGANLEYTALIPGDGNGDHPSFMLLTEASKSLAKIGINLIVRDLTNSSELWDTIEADGADIWCAAWGATVDPDMYQIYFSGDANNDAGGSNYMYDISDDTLNSLILAARKTTDQAERKEMYKECLDIIVDWAVEVPVYQRKNVIIFSPERVNMDTVTPDITTFYGWMSEIEKLEVYKS